MTYFCEIIIDTNSLEIATLAQFCRDRWEIDPSFSLLRNPCVVAHLDLTMFTAVSDEEFNYYTNKKDIQCYYQSMHSGFGSRRGNH
jgi:hypothetical protein